jgi:cytoskeleton-associated protein 5
VGGEEEEEEAEAGGEGGGAVGGAPVSLADMMPKVDISSQLKLDLIKELGDKNWKIRGEGLQKVRVLPE